jgi:hypothetical protein
VQHCLLPRVLLLKGSPPPPRSFPADVLAARLAAAGAIFEDALPAQRPAAAEEQQARTMRKGGPRRTDSDEDSDFE